jgi:uncharacterized protein YndB with AHSA1/START domain
MTKRSVAHDMFRLERRYRVSPAKVFAAWASLEAKSQWFKGPTMEALERSLDFRVGGKEIAKGRHANGVVSTFEANYYDIIPNERIVYSYYMHLDDRKISASLATIELKEVSGGTLLTMTEQGAFFDGYDDSGSRERGTKQLLEQIAEAVE